MLVDMRLAGSGVFALDAAGEDAVDIFHKLIHLFDRGIISLHIFACHDLRINLTVFGIYLMKLGFIFILFARLLLKLKLAELKLCDELIESGIFFIYFLSLSEFEIALILL